MIFLKAYTLVSALKLTNRWTFDSTVLTPLTLYNVCLWQCTHCMQTSRTPKRGFTWANFRTLSQSRFYHAVTRWAGLCILLLTDCGRTVRAMRADGSTRRSLISSRDSRSEMEPAARGHCTQSQVDTKGSARKWS